MPPMAMIHAIVCTLCKAKDGSLSLATVVSTFSVGREDGTFDSENFDLKIRTYAAIDYDPEKELGVAFAACKMHEESIINGRFGEFISGLEAISKAAAIAEAADLPVEELPEGAEGFEDDDQEEGEKEEAPVVDPASKALMDKIVTGAAGTKAVPKTSNPKPGQADPGAVNLSPEFNGDAWRQDFPDGYVVDDKTPPKGEERVMCKLWYDNLSDKEQAIAGDWTSRMSRIMISFWRKSGMYAANYANA